MRMKEHRGTVLVVDDIEQNVLVVSQILQEAGYEVVVAFSGKTALRKLERRKPDVLLLDIMMPEMNGYEVCAAMKANPEWADIPIIFLSALSDVDSKVQGFEVGGVDYITKPFNEKEVLARVAAHAKLQQLSRERMEHIQHLQELNADKDKFLSIVSHDIRSPLASIRGIGQLLSNPEDAADTATVVEFGQMMVEVTDTLLALVNDLLDLAKIESGKFVLQPLAIELQALLKQCTNYMQPAAHVKKVNINTDFAPTDIVIAGDKSKMVQIINNLLSNAIKFTPAEGIVTIGTQPANQPDFACFYIRDTGIGIPDEYVPMLFDKFGKHQRYGTDGERGTGLGLPIVKSFVELHGGEITVETVIGKGTTFYVTIPKFVS